MNAVDAWTLFKKVFKKGDEVLLVLEDDKFVFGKLVDWDDGSCLIKKTSGKSRWLPWEEIRFMSHDGFPVKLLRHEPESIEFEPSAARVIRNGLKLAGYNELIFADPFLIENVTGELFNLGNLDYDSWYEEVLVMTAPDGAQGLLWDLFTVFHVEVQ